MHPDSSRRFDPFRRLNAAERAEHLAGYLRYLHTRDGEIDVGIGIELEGEDDAESIQGTSHLESAFRLPCPELRAHVLQELYFSSTLFRNPLFKKRRGKT